MGWDANESLCSSLLVQVRYPSNDKPNCLKPYKAMFPLVEAPLQPVIIFAIVSIRGILCIFVEKSNFLQVSLDCLVFDKEDWVLRIVRSSDSIVFFRIRQNPWRSVALRRNASKVTSMLYMILNS